MTSNVCLHFPGILYVRLRRTSRSAIVPGFTSNDYNLQVDTAIYGRAKGRKTARLSNAAGLRDLTRGGSSIFISENFRIRRDKRGRGTEEGGEGNPAEGTRDRMRKRSARYADLKCNNELGRAVGTSVGTTLPRLDIVAFATFCTARPTKDEVYHDVKYSTEQGHAFVRGQSIDCPLACRLTFSTVQLSIALPRIYPSLEQDHHPPSLDPSSCTEKKERRGERAQMRTPSAKHVLRSRVIFPPMRGGRERVWRNVGWCVSNRGKINEIPGNSRFPDNASGRYG